MRKSLLVTALVLFLIGLILTSTIIGAIVGIPLIFISLILLILGIFLRPKKRKAHGRKLKR